MEKATKPCGILSLSVCVKNKSEEFHNKIVISSLYLGRYVCCWQKKGFVSATLERKFVLKQSVIKNKEA